MFYLRFMMFDGGQGMERGENWMRIHVQGSPACILRRLRTTRKANLPKDQNSKDVAQGQPVGFYAPWILTQPTKCTQLFTCQKSAWTPANWLFLDSRPVHCSCLLALLGALAFFFVPASKKVVPHCCAIYSSIDSKSDSMLELPKKQLMALTL